MDPNFWRKPVGNPRNRAPIHPLGNYKGISNGRKRANGQKLRNLHLQSVYNHKFRIINPVQKARRKLHLAGLISSVALIREGGPNLVVWKAGRMWLAFRAPPRYRNWFVSLLYIAMHSRRCGIADGFQA